MARRTSVSLVRAFRDFVRLEAAGGIVLLVATALALAWANSPWAPWYAALWDTPVVVGVGAFGIAKPLLLWVNDGLMALFFFVVGLEIKREVLVGELASLRRATLPAAAAVGGMVVPAAIYLGLNLGGPGSHGWGIPMATDIAFALGVITLLGDRVPLGLKVFLAALAIVDDLGAVLVIAIFYTAELNLVALGVGLGIFAVMVVLSGAGVRRIGLYGLLGVVLWIAFLKSGIHATLAGVLAAVTIPASARIHTTTFRSRSRELLDAFEIRDVETGTHRLSAEQQEVVLGLAGVVREVESPLHRLEHALHPWVSFVIMPVFALANAGIVLGGGLVESATHPVTLGIVLGLVGGKLIGVVGFSWLVTTIGLAELPSGATWRQVTGVAALAGIGFTMSLFIASLAFGDSPLLDNAKVGILGASLLAGVLGVALLLTGPRATAESG
ncbi:MAG: Na+/H+ antiporter NhaA [Gemmatimonadota bacterium]|nr:Na+/H+ antiporter NhaA [Gemmatimonadota bacterium]MDH4351908.1 Na+/H+ antiporter NhaA [Gemmatimonadota bacterium]